jgi:hypothetical protein
MSAFKLSASTLSAAWRNSNPEITAGMLLSVDSITDSWAKRMVGRAKRRWDLTMNPNAAAIANEDTYIGTACQPSVLKGFCFVAADEIAVDLTGRGAQAKCVRVEPKKGGGDHYFCVVNKGSAKNSIIVDATWLQFALAGQPFCLVGTLDKLQETLKKMKPTIDLADAYKAGLDVVGKWGAYNCFQ